LLLQLRYEYVEKRSTLIWTNQICKLIYLSLFRRCGFLSTTSDTFVRDATHENLLLAISQLERIDLFIYGVDGKKTKTFLKCIQPARIGRKDREFVGKNGEKESMDRESVPISGQSPANFGACQIHPCSAVVHPPRARPPKPMLRGIARFCTPSFGVASFYTRAESRSLALAFAHSLRHARPINPRGAMEGLCTCTRRKTAGDDCGLRPRKTIAVERQYSDFEFIKE